MGQELNPDNALVCACFAWTEAKLREAVARLGLTTFEEVATTLLAGSGCTTCRPDVEAILEELEAPRKLEGEDQAAPSTAKGNPRR